MLRLPASGVVTIMDGGCGAGAAIDELRTELLSGFKPGDPQPRVRLYGVESDKGRACRANALFGSHAESEGECLWSSIEDAGVTHDCSVLWFNPPYDRIRGGDRLELLLYQKVCEWTARGGHMVLIVPDYILEDYRTGLAVAVERTYECQGVWRFPEPEYSVFKQCVLIGKRRAKALDRNKVEFPAWARASDNWPALPDKPKPLFDIRAVCAENPGFYRHSISSEVVRDVLSHSPLRNSLLREALAPAAKPEAPLLPLKEGHLALALAGGLCDGIVEENDIRFLVKGSLQSASRKVAERKNTDDEGMHVSTTDIMRTTYEMKVRCLREDGSIEEYSSHEGDALEVETGHEKEAAA
jgi:hypothetical protein